MNTLAAFPVSFNADQKSFQAGKQLLGPLTVSTVSSQIIFQLNKLCDALATVSPSIPGASWRRCRWPQQRRQKA